MKNIENVKKSLEHVLNKNYVDFSKEFSSEIENRMKTVLSKFVKYLEKNAFNKEEK